MMNAVSDVRPSLIISSKSYRLSLRDGVETWMPRTVRYHTWICRATLLHTSDCLIKPTESVPLFCFFDQLTRSASYFDCTDVSDHVGVEAVTVAQMQSTVAQRNKQLVRQRPLPFLPRPPTHLLSCAAKIPPVSLHQYADFRFGSGAASAAATLCEALIRYNKPTTPGRLLT